MTRAKLKDCANKRMKTLTLCWKCQLSSTT